MKPQIQTIFNWLREKPGNIIEIHNAALGSCIDNRFTAQKAAPYGSVEKYFEHLYTNGVREITIVQKEKNGTSIKNKKAPISYTLVREDATPKNLFTPSPAAPQNNNTMEQGLMGAAQSVGLSQAQVFEMHTASKRLPEVISDLSTSRAKCEKLEDQVKQLEKENLEYKLGILGRESGGEKLLKSLSDPENLKSIAAVAASAIANAKSKALTPGLAQPGNLTNNPTKNTLIKIIADDATSEETAIFIYHVIDKVRKGDQQFIDNVAQLIEPKTQATNG